MYLTYEEYQEYGGALPEGPFRLLEFQARKRLDYLTADRIKAMEEAGQVPESVKMCVYALIDLNNKAGAIAQMTNPVVTGFTTDGYSEQYKNVLSATEANAEMDRLILEMLAGELDLNGVPLLYRGVWPYATMHGHYHAL